MWNPEECCGHCSRFVCLFGVFFFFSSSLFSSQNLMSKWRNWSEFLLNITGFVDGLEMGNNTKVSANTGHGLDSSLHAKFWVQRYDLNCL